MLFANASKAHECSKTLQQSIACMNSDNFYYRSSQDVEQDHRNYKSLTFLLFVEYALGLTGYTHFREMAYLLIQASKYYFDLYANHIIHYTSFWRKGMSIACYIHV